MKTLRIISLASILIGFGLMSSCDLFPTSTDPDAPRPKISSFEIEMESGDPYGSQTLTAGSSTIAITCSILSEIDLKELKFVVTSPDGYVIPSVFPTVETSGRSYSILGGNPNYLYTIPDGSSNGSYIITLTATDIDNQSTTAIKTFCVGSDGCSGSDPGTTTHPLTQFRTYAGGAPIIAGAQSNNNPSFLAILAGTTYGVADVTDWSLIDLMYLADAGGTPYLYSPDQAQRDNTLSSLPASGLNSTELYTTSASYDNLNTKEDVLAAISSASGPVAKVAASSGSVYLFRLATGQVGVIKITAKSGSGKASQITVKWATST